MIQEIIRTHPPEWLVSFGLVDRIGTPDLFLSRESVLGASHAAAMRVGFEIGVSGYLCVGSVPTVVFLIRDGLDQAEVDRVHKALWNQGLASVLLVVVPSAIRVYSLWRRPVAIEGHSIRGRDKRLIEVLDLATEALSVLSARQLISSVESGQYFEEHSQAFDRRTRIDTTLLANLRITQQDLVRQGLSADASRALLLQTIFIAYLEDRAIVEPDYYVDVLPGENVRSFIEVLGRGDLSLLARLFAALREHFNGDIFYAPSSFDPNDQIPALTPEHLSVLALFRALLGCTCGSLTAKKGNENGGPKEEGTLKLRSRDDGSLTAPLVMRIA